MDSFIISLEHELLPVVQKMELHGVQIDMDKLLEVQQQLNTISETTVKRILTDANQNDLNLNSPEQVSKLLFQTLKLNPLIKPSDSGIYSVDKSHLNKIKNQHEVVGLLLKYRECNTLLKFCSQLNQIHPLTGRLHCSLNQMGTATGRFSCSSPNLQNIPKVKGSITKNDEIKILKSKFREVFVAKKGHQFVCADYSQIELRITAELSQDVFLVRAYNEDIDIHELTASEVFGIKISEVTDEQRSIAKSINFGLIYGTTAYGLSESLTQITGKEHSREQAEKVMTDYFERFKGVKKCLDQLIEFADKYGYSRTLFGRIRPIPELQSNTISEREKGKRLAMNSPIQGSAADIIKMAMIKCDKEITQKGLKSKMILQVHDELLFEVPNNEVEIMMKLVKSCMENAVQLSIPLAVEIKNGANWAVAH